MTEIQNVETLKRENGFYQCKMCPRIFYTEFMIGFHTKNEHKIEIQPTNKNQDKIECQQHSEQNSTTNNKIEFKPKNNSIYNTPISEESTNKYRTENQPKNDKDKNSHDIGEEKNLLKSLPTESRNSYNLRSKPIKIQPQKATKPQNEPELSTEDVKDLDFKQTTSTLKKEINLAAEKLKSVQPPRSDKSLPIDTNLQANKNKILVHEKLNLYQCQDSEKSFTKNCHLQAHINTSKYFNHNILKPFKCSECSKEFSKKKNLTYHIRYVHKKVRPFKCQCGVTCVNKFRLKTHVDVVHNKIKRYLCPECPKSYGRNVHLQDHITIIHKKIKSYKCSFCPKSYGYQNQIYKHKSTHEKKLKKS